MNYNGEELNEIMLLNDYNSNPNLNPNPNPMPNTDPNPNEGCHIRDMSHSSNITNTSEEMMFLNDPNPNPNPNPYPYPKINNNGEEIILLNNHDSNPNHDLNYNFSFNPGLGEENSLEIYGERYEENPNPNPNRNPNPNDQDSNSNFSPGVSYNADLSQSSKINDQEFQGDNC
jgi:hypothetical protein